jgi:hypothetical protein
VPLMRRLPNAARATRTALGLATIAILASSCAMFQKPKLNEYGNPLKLKPVATTPAITDADLRTRLYIFADDSMMGRMAGREGNAKGTAYIARELARLHVEPAGDSGTYFQALPWVARTFARTSTLSVNGHPFRWLDDWAAVPGAGPTRSLDGVRAIYGGVAFDTAHQITTAQAQGKLVILAAASPAAVGGGGQAQRLAAAAAIATVDLQTLGERARTLWVNPAATLIAPSTSPQPMPAPVVLRVTPAAATAIMGRALDGLPVATEGAAVTAKLDLVERPVPQYGRNVVAIIRGADARLRGEYVAIGAHNDHIGFNAAPVDHDSARLAATALLKLQTKGGALEPLTVEQRASVKVNVDSLRKLRKPRRDSIYNGADDDGSGSMAVLEIAEAVATDSVKPRRSVLFVWHTGEERGLLGSRWFTDHPTVPRDSIVAQINIDMIGRGRTDDLPGGGADYLAVVGSRRLSTELGKEVVAVNLRQPNPLRLDYRFDAPTTWPGYNNIYERSDHANYARYGIPIAFFFTGLHQDYHRVTDEPQYIDYAHYGTITRYLKDLVLDVANLEHRLAVDKK